MSSLTDIDKRYLEKLLGMGIGYVLDFSDNTYGEFFARHKINIHGPKFQTYPAPKFELSKHIKIDERPEEALFVEDEEEALKGDSVSTDLVVTNTENKKPAVIPLKITTRERIVQPFAHQRILDSAYPELYNSFLTCTSEVQRDDKTTSVKQICAPGTVALFQKHSARLGGLYYCDIPQRYARQDFRALIKVAGLSELFDDIDDWLDR